MRACPAKIWTAERLLQAALPRLRHLGSARLDAELLLGTCLGLTRSALRAHPEHPVPRALASEFLALVDQRARGMPIAYLTGEAEFWSLKLKVNAHTLIPRPETELLVECALRRIPVGARHTVADLGTGCGAIAIAIARERPNCRVIATDFSHAALRVARANAGQHGCRHIEFRHGDWLAALSGDRCDVIVANPPYIAAADPHLEGDGVRCEPRTSLISGSDGLTAIRQIIANAPCKLVRGGWLLLEHGWNQGPAVRRLYGRSGFAHIRTWHDLAGLPRVSEGCHVRS